MRRSISFRDFARDASDTFDVIDVVSEESIEQLSVGSIAQGSEKYKRGNPVISFRWMEVFTKPTPLQRKRPTAGMADTAKRMRLEKLNRGENVPFEIPFSATTLHQWMILGYFTPTDTIQGQCVHTILLRADRETRIKNQEQRRKIKEKELAGKATEEKDPEKLLKTLKTTNKEYTKRLNKMRKDAKIGSKKGKLIFLDKDNETVISPVVLPGESAGGSGAPTYERTGSENVSLEECEFDVDETLAQIYEEGFL